jgi:hypothetical protein
MEDIKDVLSQMRNNPQGIRFAELCQVCDYYFGNPRQSRSSHRIYQMPWSGDPRVNIQNYKGMAKPYQVKQVLKAIERLHHEKTTKK